MNKEINSSRLKDYSMDDYFSDINLYGISTVWEKILECLINENIENDFLKIDNFGEIYEIGLEYCNKKKKKKEGKYYTPKDVSLIMSQWFDSLNGYNICDVGCGTGNLVLTYLNFIGEEEAKKIIEDGRLYLYDLDKTALMICKYTIAIKYGSQLLDKINIICGDFLDKKIKLPNDCKVISNPPYFKIDKIKRKWGISKVIADTKEYYSAFMEKIMRESKASVIISPYSFISGNKFYSLREEMDKYNGFIISFDNVPGNIFCGKKHGVFNTNNSNSVRAAITVVENKDDIQGFRLTPLIRFKTSERKKLLNCETLEKLIHPVYQKIDQDNKKYYKCFPKLDFVYKKWNENSTLKIKDLICDNENKYKIVIPNTCRYFTTASSYDLKRIGKYVIYAKDEKSFYYLYGLINSSFVYWNWRLYDGGINYPYSLFIDTPVFIDKIKETDYKELKVIVDEMMIQEKTNLVYKKNASKIQENIKFPIEFRNKLNSIFLNVLNIDLDYNVFDVIHSNSYFEGVDNNE